MRRLETFESKHFGNLEYDPDDVIHFPFGLPAFEQETSFLPVQRPETEPVVFLQSLRSSQLVFITLPVQLVDPAYDLVLSPEDQAALELAPAARPRIGVGLLCQVIVTLGGAKPPTANLMAPIVVNMATRRAIQVIQAESGYSHQHPLEMMRREGKTC